MRKLRTLSTHNLVNTIARAVATPRQHNVVGHYKDILYVVAIAWPDALRTAGSLSIRDYNLAWRESGHARLYCTVAKS